MLCRVYSPSEHDAEAGQNTQFRAIASVSHHAVEVPKRSGCVIKCNFIAAQSFSPEESSAKVGGCELSTHLACVQTHQSLLRRLRAAWLEKIALSAEDYSFR